MRHRETGPRHVARGQQRAAPVAHRVALRRDADWAQRARLAGQRLHQRRRRPPPPRGAGLPRRQRTPQDRPADDDLVPIHSASASFEDLKHSNDDSLTNPTPARDDIDSKLTKNNSSKESIVDIVLVNDNIDMKSSMCSDVAPVHWSKSMDRLGELLSPAEETISMFTQLSDKLSEVSAAEGDSGVDTAHVSDDEACRPEKWTILDLQFGIPLFDEALCESVCGSVVGCVAAPDVLDKIKEDNEFIRADVLKFVSQCQVSSTLCFIYCLDKGTRSWPAWC
uniref:FAM91 C-terminal domain-containing protein n=1 Tax=Bombyx mori TaxID=7091 RepID=A0A8R2M8U5_BOMMO|nr:uncharacterized protein LOC119630975 [Bombyx mori]